MAGAAVAILQSWGDKSKTKNQHTENCGMERCKEASEINIHYRNNPATAQLLKFLLHKIVNSLYYSSDI